MDKKRDEFRKYLENAGAIDNLTQALVKLYEQKNKPQDVIKFLRKQMCDTCHDEEEFELLEADLKEANAKICQLEREISRLKGEVKRTQSEVDLALTQGFDGLIANKETQILLKKIFRKNFIEDSRELKTSFKGTLLDCIQSGLQLLDSPIRVYACDEEAYCMFDFIFNPLVEMLHQFRSSNKQPELNWGDACKLPELDPNFVKTIRVSCRRNIKGYPFAPLLSFEQYEEILDKFACATKCLCGGNLKGKLYPLEGISDEDRCTFASNGLLFSNDDEALEAANGYRFWPTGRGIFANEEMNFVVLCNQQDHFKFIGIDLCGNLSECEFDRFIGFEIF